MKKIIDVNIFINKVQSRISFNSSSDSNKFYIKHLKEKSLTETINLQNFKRSFVKDLSKLKPIYLIFTFFLFS